MSEDYRHSISMTKPNPQSSEFIRKYWIYFWTVMHYMWKGCFTFIFSCITTKKEYLDLCRSLVTLGSPKAIKLSLGEYFIKKFIISSFQQLSDAFCHRKRKVSWRTQTSLSACGNFDQLEGWKMNIYIMAQNIQRKWINV